MLTIFQKLIKLFTGKKINPEQSQMQNEMQKFLDSKKDQITKFEIEAETPLWHLFEKFQVVDEQWDSTLANIRTLIDNIDDSNCEQQIHEINLIIQLCRKEYKYLINEFTDMMNNSKNEADIDLCFIISNELKLKLSIIVKIKTEMDILTHGNNSYFGLN